MEDDYLARDEDRIAFYEGMRCCANPGPRASVCTEAFPGHQGEHKDATTGEHWPDEGAEAVE